MQKNSLITISTEMPLKERYGSKERTLAIFNPAMQEKYCIYPERCVLGYAPQLARLEAEYGGGTALSWLVVQIWNLNEWCGTRDKMTKDQIDTLARMILARFGWLKLTEIMLFFFRIKSGRYGHFYGAIDPLRVMEYIGIFISERNQILDEDRQRRQAEEYEQWKIEAVSYEEYKAKVGHVSPGMEMLHQKGVI